jgi:DNA-binding GntR family transcriptional regulator
VSEGLLQRGTHKTARVPALGPDDIRDLYFTRILIESEVVRRAAAQKRLPPGLTDAHDHLLAVSQQSTSAVVEPVVKFHHALVRSLGSARLNRIFDTLMSEMRLCMAQMQARNLLVPHCIADEHERIIEQILAGNPDGAAAAMVEHLMQAQERLLPALEAEQANAKPMDRATSR